PTQLRAVRVTMARTRRRSRSVLRSRAANLRSAPMLLTPGPMSRQVPTESPEELPVQAGYAAWASCYDDDGNPLIALEEPAVRAWFGPLHGKRALDLGCGTGRHTAALV